MTGQNNNGSQVLEGSYLKYLPGLYREDEFMGQFLRIFESVMKPIENTIDSLDLYFDPQMTPEPLLPWLASWLDLVLNPTWPLKRRRNLVKSCAELYRWRGTKRGLSEFIKIYTGTEPEISEYVEGMRLDSETRLGIHTKLGSSGAGHQFTVMLDINEDDDVDIDTVRAIIDNQKPAHTFYTLPLGRPKQIGDDKG